MRYFKNIDDINENENCNPFPCVQSKLLKQHSGQLFTNAPTKDCKTYPKQCTC